MLTWTRLRREQTKSVLEAPPTTNNGEKDKDIIFVGFKTIQNNLAGYLKRFSSFYESEVQR